MSYLLFFVSVYIFGHVVVLAQDLVGPHSLPPLATTWPPPPQWFAGGRIFEESERSREDSPRGRVLISSARFIPCEAPRTGAFVLAALVASGAAFAYLRRLVQRCFSAAGSFLAHPSSLHCQLQGLPWTRRYKQRQFSHSPTWSGFMLYLGWVLQSLRRLEAGSSFSSSAVLWSLRFGILSTSWLYSILVFSLGATATWDDV